MTKRYRVAFTQKSRSHLVSIYRLVAREASPSVAETFTNEILEHCLSFETFPLRGTRRDDLRPGLRIVGYRRRVSIAFIVDDDVVTILGIFYGGRDIQRRL